MTPYKNGVWDAGNDEIRIDNDEGGGMLAASPRVARK
jgi:hypothetical protein